MNRHFLTFLQEPSGESYKAVWQSVVHSPSYEPYSDALKIMAQRFSEDRHEEVMRLSEQVIGNFLLSPALHYYAGRSSGALGDSDRENMERFIYRKLRDALLATGDGTINNPFLVAHVDDEYDILSALKRAPVHQSLVTHENGRVFDVFSEEDETETWFDITEMYKSARTKQQNEANEQRKFSQN